ncbi:hypothetical protein JXB28_01410 [Candidatus Woesearchaeota archaeon]|nr:hypothetical protein [Candidatus Woesearchaeota archaeon]
MVHMFNESHLEDFCPNCRKPHNNGDGNGGWKPEWWRHEHYMTMICECGYKIHRLTPHFSSGHY